MKCKRKRLDYNDLLTKKEIMACVDAALMDMPVEQAEVIEKQITIVRERLRAIGRYNASDLLIKLGAFLNDKYARRS